MTCQVGGLVLKGLDNMGSRGVFFDDDFYDQLDLGDTTQGVFFDDDFYDQLDLGDTTQSMFTLLQVGSVPFLVFGATSWIHPTAPSENRALMSKPARKAKKQWCPFDDMSSHSLDGCNVMLKDKAEFSSKSSKL
uniref:Uncharacterized protein n=1 Tax=Oryza rufipogon TaxID=4529 RepID=A0A0E0R8A3_ORYRU